MVRARPVMVAGSPFVIRRLTLPLCPTGVSAAGARRRQGEAVPVRTPSAAWHEAGLRRLMRAQNGAMFFSAFFLPPSPTRTPEGLRASVENAEGLANATHQSHCAESGNLFPAFAARKSTCQVGSRPLERVSPVKLV
jgi:hypothetical protein